MLGVLCTHPTVITKHSSFYHHTLRRHHLHFLRLHHRSPASSSSLSLPSTSTAGVASIWNTMLPSPGGFFGPRHPGESSWNVAWDARPARWLHRPDSAWLLFGVCGFVASIAYHPDSLDRAAEEVVAVDENNNRVQVDAKTAEQEEAAEKD